MIYITVKQSPLCHQMTLEEFLFGNAPRSTYYNPNETNTRTYAKENLSEVFLRRTNVDRLIRKLDEFNTMFSSLREKEKALLLW